MHSSESPSRLATTNTDDLLRLPREMANISACCNSLSWKVLFFLLPRRLGMQAHKQRSLLSAVLHNRCGANPIQGTRWTCEPCDYDVCTSCRKKRHPHSFVPLQVTRPIVCPVANRVASQEALPPNHNDERLFLVSSADEDAEGELDA